MKIVVIEPYLTQSHEQWARSFTTNEDWDVKIISLPGRHWKWRMHGGAITLAMQLLELEEQPDLILASDMMDLSLFRTMIRKKYNTAPIVLYFHENQLTYPYSQRDQDRSKHWDNHYGFVNYTSALTADWVVFNSRYHQDTFFNALEKLLTKLPSPTTYERIEEIRQKSSVIYPGIDFSVIQQTRVRSFNRPTIVWNHRWEYDKNPEDFFHLLFKISELGGDFDLVVLGEAHQNNPAIFDQAKASLARHLIHWGYVDSRDEYYQWLWKANILLCTSNQDFFGISVVEAIYCTCWPILPHRLAFPEHIPETLHDRCLYRSDREFGNMLESALMFKPDREEDQSILVQHMRKKYSLSKVHGQYTDLFQQLLSGKNVPKTTSG